MPSLNLADYFLSEELEFIESKVFRNGHLWEVRKRRQEFEICPHCAQKTSIRCGKAYSTVREAPIREHSLWLRVQKHRYFCKPCGKRFTESVQGIWPRRKTTTYFRHKVAEDCGRFTNLSLVRQRHHCSSGFLYSVHYEGLKRKLNQRKGIAWPTILGVDEHFFSRRKGFTEFTTVFCDLKKRRLFEMVLGKDRKSITEQIESIPGREDVRVVVIDLSNGYRGIIKKLFPNAIIVADKFHALRLITPALLKLRGSTSKQGA